jgi:hypothetical protein
VRQQLVPDILSRGLSFGNYQVDVPNQDVVETMCIANATTATDEEIEITPEMIKAGRLAFDAFSMADLYDGWQSPEEVICSVFAAMAQAGELAIRSAHARSPPHRLSISFEEAGRFPSSRE